MKKLLYTASLALLGTITQAQVKVGDNPGTINGGSALEIESTNKGLLMPRVALTSTTTWGLAGTPTAGMSVYNTGTGLSSSNTAYPAAGVGEYYWDGTGWVSKKGGAQSSVGADNGLTVGYNSTGNVGLGGTLGKNTEVATAGKTLGFSGSGFVGVGTAAPKSKLALSNDGGGGGLADDISIYSYGSNVAPALTTVSSAGTEAAPANITNGTSIGYLGFGGRWNNAWNLNSTNIFSTYKGDGTTTLSNLGFATANTTRMLIDENGNVGVGTTSPATKLEVNNGTTAGAIKIVDGTQASGKVLMSDANGVGTWQTPASIRPTIIGVFPSPGQTIIPNGSSSPIYSQIYIDLPQGKWIVSAGLTLSYFVANSRLWLHTYLSSSTTSIAQSGFTHLGPSGNNTSIAGPLTNNTASTSGALNFLPGSSVINVTASTGVRIYLMVENSATGSWSFYTANYEMYFYAVPIN
jgi:hypothetical protein